MTSSPQPMRNKAYRIDAVLFDLDGTLTQPGALDFPALKRDIGCPLELPVLEFMAGLKDEDRRREITRRLDAFELEGALSSRPNAGARQLIGAIKKAGLPVGILTRNSRASTLRALENFDGVSPSDIDVIVTREDPVKIKPSGQGVLLAARKMEVDPAHVLVVGDFSFDMDAGRDAGALTAFLANKSPVPDGLVCDFVIDALADLEPILAEGVCLAAGKLPNAFLEELLAHYRIEDPSVIVGPSVGEDTAAVDIDGQQVLVLKSDPITFATEAIGRYAVLINANDMATAGVDARWMLATLLLPCGFTRSRVRQIFADLNAACTDEGITLCGGHTEITDAVRRPVVTGMMAGTIASKDLIRKDRMAPGDRLLVTKGIAVEGTAIIAAEFSDLLLEKGMTVGEIESCRRLAAMISILPEARIAWHVGGVSALHDVTEGGIATAVAELSQAGGRGLRIRKEAVPVFGETRRMGQMLEIDPLGLIGSGSLLICCRPDRVEQLVAELTRSGIAVADIGEVTDGPPGVEAFENGAPAVWPAFAVDEITRLFNR
ncbi:HAD-IA family hydrolase [uncultured Desulfosarcina sp.]|uniref:HAD-IA family hydrolase n=1 Tax=uncultured Desulfosarcina sp. TaxID=218289 RepID=UPI0029C847B9|nr:HAD-IA family hydrolase [uncultured Desulfosarcina sp.]